MGSAMPTVTDLSQELIVSVAQRLDLLEDFLDFGAVCRSWRWAAAKENFAGAGSLSHQVPLLMLPRVIDTIQVTYSVVDQQPQKKKIVAKNIALSEEIITDMVDFYSLARGKILRLNLPEIKRKLCFSSLGWLLTQSEKDSKFNLLHPISHSKIELPDGFPFQRLREIRKFVLSSSPRSWNSDYTVMLQTYYCVLFCRPGLGDKCWTILDTKKHCIRELCCFRGHFYVVQSEAIDAIGLRTRTWISVICDDFKDLREVAPTIPEELLTPYVKKHYLVESAGVLLLVLFTRHPECYEQTVGCRVFELPRNGSSWKDSEVKSLGNRTLFLSPKNSSFSVEASDYPGCRPNCIYFINVAIVSPQVDMDIGIFDMADGRIDRHPFRSFSTGFEHIKNCPLWIQPTSS